ncbi:MAG: sigma-54-dependent Fis family transcriptional regulator, partial [Syntrophobacteraceae bacterium]|nr:sigma-54-dependent Fis family transcriptional regulator [Syntrophobacteraceae bacterium]
MPGKSPGNRTRILIVDDEEGARESLELILEDYYAAESVENGLDAVEKLKKKPFDVVLLDINMPDLDGIETLKRIKDIDDSVEVVMVSAADRAWEATASMKSGACDYVTKPYEPEEILTVIGRAFERRCSRQELSVPPCPGNAFRFDCVEIVSQAPNMHAIFHRVQKVAPTSSNILITGESGTGKELIARAIHVVSERRAKPFVAINCAAVPPELLESELFGHERGAFTSAHARKIGKFEYAHGGTIFLDEISSLRQEFQAKLLRFLQEREFSRVGSHQTIKVDVRLIAATNMRLEQLVRQKLFRSDLYFRLNVIPIEIPPLRERKGDIPLLSGHFLVKFNKMFTKKVKGISPEAMEVLESYPWPGNVRELENLMERLVVLGADEKQIGEEDLPIEEMLGDESHEEEWEMDEGRDMGLHSARQAFERRYVLKALERCNWNLSDTARLLKVHRNTLL